MTAAGHRDQRKPFHLASRKTRHSAWLLLRQRDFRLYFIGSLVSNFGTWLQSTAQILIAYEVTHSVFIVGLIAAAQFAGMTLVSPWAAVVADRVGPKTLLVATQGASACIACWMAWRYHSGVLGVHTLVVGALGLGFAYALALPVQTAFIPALVDSVDTANALKMNAVSYNAGRALAPALGVLVITLVGPDLIFVLNALSFSVFTVCLHATVGRLKSANGNATARSYAPHHEGAVVRRTHVTDGLLIALRQPRILLLLAIVATVTLADDPILVLSPAVAHAKLHLSNAWVGYFIAALGWGSILGSLPPTSHKLQDVRAASRRAAVSLLILGLAVPVFATGLSTPLSLFAACTAGAAALFTGTAAQTALMRHHQNNFTSVAGVASITALWAIAWAGTKPFASLLDGWLASHIGVFAASEILVLPAILIALLELALPQRGKTWIRAFIYRNVQGRAARKSSAEDLPIQVPDVSQITWSDR
jgi:MFS family permease